MNCSEEFSAFFDVSRETLARLQVYEELIKKWNPVINLVSRTTINQIWSRHFCDSATVFEAASSCGQKWVDLGSGGGFPGMVVAILAAEKKPEISVTCIESDIRKCEFLRTVSRQVNVVVKILSRRIEEAPNQQADFVSARALAPLDRLLHYVHDHLNPDGTAFLHKGKNWLNELQTAKDHWAFDYKPLNNSLSLETTILEIRNLKRD